MSQFPLKRLDKFRHNTIFSRSRICIPISIPDIFRSVGERYISANISAIIERCVTYQSRHISSGVRERDSEFTFVLCSFSLRKINKILYALDKGVIRDSSGSIVFADNLKRAIAIARQVIPTRRFSVPGGDGQRRRKIIYKTNRI